MPAEITNEELTAYLDGAADAALVARIDDGLAKDTDLQARLASLDVDLDKLKAECTGILKDAPSNLVPTDPPKTQSWMTGGAVAASLLLGLGFGYLAFDRSAQANPDWMDYVAAYQALYVTETLDTVADGSATELASLSKVLGLELQPAAEVPELTFKRGQILGFESNPLIQIAYLTEQGTPVALCILRNDALPSGIEHSELEGMQSASWSDGTFAYLLIGGDDAALIERSAAHFETQL